MSLQARAAARVSSAISRAARTGRPPGIAADALAAVLRGGAVLLALQFANVGCAYATQVLLARWLGGVEYGIYAYAWAWAGLLAVPAGIGLHDVALRFVPAYAEAGDGPMLFGFLRWSSRTVFAAGILIGAASAAIALILRDRIPAHYLLPLLLAFAAVPFLALSTLRINQGFGLGSPAAGYLPWVLGSNLGVLGGVALLHPAGRLDAAATLVVALVVLALVVVAQTRAIHRQTARPATVAAPDTRRWLRVAGPLLVSMLFYVLLERADLVLVGTLLGPREAGVYAAAARTALLASFSATAITSLATPRLAPLHAQGGVRLGAFTAAVAPWIFFPSLAAAIVLVAFGGPILSLFGPGFQAGWTALALLAAAHVVPATVGLAPHLLNMTGHEVGGAVVMGAAVVVSIALGLLFIPRLGMNGAALATAGAMLMRSVGHAVLVRRRLGVHTFLPLAWEARAS